MSLENFTIVLVNIGEEKWYAPLYQDFCDHFTLTQVQFDVILCKNINEIIHFWGIFGVSNFISK